MNISLVKHVGERSLNGYTCKVYLSWHTFLLTLFREGNSKNSCLHWPNKNVIHHVVHRTSILSSCPVHFHNFKHPMIQNNTKKTQTPSLFKLGYSCCKLHILVLTQYLQDGIQSNISINISRKWVGGETGILIRYQLELPAQNNPD